MVGRQIYSSHRAAHSSPIGSRVTVAVVVALALAACGGTVPSSPVPSAALPSGRIPTNPANVVKGRDRLGLPSDSATIARLLANPLAVRAYGTILTVEEKAALDARTTDQAAVYRTVERYGSRVPEAYGGVWVDGAIVVAAFTAPALIHESQLTALVSPRALLRVVEVRYSLATLTRLAQQVDAEASWFPSAGASFEGTGVDLERNLVVVRIRANDTSVAEAVAAHFGHPDWLAVEVAGPLVWSGATGDLEIRVVNAAGQPVAGFECRPVPVDPTVVVDSFAVSDSGGRCTFSQLPSVAYRVRISRSATGEWVEVGHVPVRVDPGQQKREVYVAEPVRLRALLVRECDLWHLSSRSHERWVRSVSPSLLHLGNGRTPARGLTLHRQTSTGDGPRGRRAVTLDNDGWLIERHRTPREAHPRELATGAA